MTTKKKLLIVVEGGLIQDIKNIPEGLEIEIRDYDADQYSYDDLEAMKADEDGRRYFVTEW